MEIRRAVPGDAVRLSDLAIASKQFWGYDAAFMEKCREELTVSPAYIEANQTWVLEVNGAIVGFYILKGEAPEAELTFLFIAPDCIRQGYGRRLWDNAVALAKELGIETIAIESDPYAEGFYTALGAVVVGRAPSGSIPGRFLPLMQYRVLG